MHISRHRYRRMSRSRTDRFLSSRETISSQDCDHQRLVRHIAESYVHLLSICLCLSAKSGGFFWLLPESGSTILLHKVDICVREIHSDRKGAVHHHRGVDRLQIILCGCAPSRECEVPEVSPNP